MNVATVRNVALQATVATHLPPADPVTQSSTSATFPRMAADPTIAGRLYLVYGDPPTPGPTGFQGADHFINFEGQVWFQRSTDNGATWSTPKRISDWKTLAGARTHQTRHPNVSVSPGGRVNIVWHDRRHWFQGPGERNCTHSHIFCEDIRLGDTYYSYSTDGGVTFSDNIRITDRSHNNDVGYDARPAIGYWAWGPQAVTIGGGLLLIGFMDSREGNTDTENEDYYLAKVNFDAGGPAPATHVDAPEVVSRAIALSRIGYRAGNEGALIGGPRDPANVGFVIAADRRRHQERLGRDHRQRR